MDWIGSRYVDNRCTLFQGESGVLLDIPSLPGIYGVGEIGPHALKFIKVLHDTGQKLWHVLSLHTFHPERLFTGTSYGWNTSLISFAWLRDDALISQEELSLFQECLPKTNGSIEAVYDLRNRFLSYVAENFDQRASPKLRGEFIAFQKYHHLWLNKFSLFQTLGEEFGGKAWYEWPDRLRSFDHLAIEAAQKQLAEKIHRKNVLQFLFLRYWERLHSEAQYLGIRIILSVPVFVLHNSYELWANQSLFFVDGEGRMTATSGFPPSKKMEHGKRFAGPQYRWNRIKAEAYKFWINRLRRELQVVDMVLLENFHALFECHEFPVEGGEEGMANGRLVPTGDQHLLECVFETLQTKNIIAGDFMMSNLKMERAIGHGEMANAVAMPFCFSKEKGATMQVLPKYYTRGHIAYTSNYFSDSLLRWLKRFTGPLTLEMRKELQRCFGTALNGVNRNALLTLRNSNAGAVMTTLQDLLEVECDGDTFLSWRFTWDQIDDVIKTRLLQFSQRGS
ncbi:MAG: 4-alpha-glucanotransferase [Puniceicoccales bacterium]|jgi:4-alpha-glucanotransferase|nr:4-alpha-glucanotransferase [Puniceicoccales bacterium]